MSIFNPNDFATNNISENILTEVADNYLRSNGITNSLATTSFLGDVNLTSNTNISGNILANGTTISPTELSYLDNVTSNIQQQINNISGGSILNTNNIFTGINQFNNDIVVNSTNISPTELSYINNTTSNIQTQINTSNINIDTINTTLTNNGITSASNVTSALEYLQSQISNLPNSGGGTSVTYFFTETANIINNIYKTISKIPANNTNFILTTGIITNSSGNVLMGQFLSNEALNITSIPAGIWDFNFFTNITNNNLISYLVVEVYRYLTNGSLILLFTITGSDINSAVIIPYNVNSSENSYAVNASDYLAIKIYGATTSAQNVTININYNSSTNYSHFHIPLAQTSNHNDLLNIQGGTTNQYNHLTNTQLNNVINASSVSSNGYLTNTDWNTFNNKQNLISQNTAFNKNYEILTSNIKMNNNVSVGILDTIARSDHVHPVDTSREPIITAGTTGQYFRGDKTFQILDKSAVGLSNVVNKDFTQGINGIIYVSKSGNDSNDGLSLINAYLTITAALNNTYINSGYQLVIYPGTYTENLNINKNNLSIVGTNNEIGGIINIAGNITITSSNTSIRLCSLSFVNFSYTGTNTNVYLKDCNISGNLTKSNGGYLSINSCIFGLTSGITISGSGNVNCLNGCNLGVSFLVNNSGAIVNISNCLTMVALQVLAGICSINDTVLYSINSTLFAVNSSVGSIVYLQNLSLVNGNDNTPAKLNLLGFWSINNVNYNKTLSTLSGTNLQREYLFDKVNINNNLTITGNINDTTTTELSYLNNVTSDIQTQLNNKIGLSNNNEFTGINSFTQLLTKNINSNIGVGDIILKPLTNLTTGTYNVCIGQNTGRFITQGNYNTILGPGSGDNLTVGNNNILIGRFNDMTTGLGNTSNSIAIGSGVTLRGSNLIQIGTSTETTEFDGPVKLNNTNTISGNTTISGTLNLTNANSTAITQTETDNSTKIATTAFVKLFSAPLKKYLNNPTAPYIFNFGPSDYFEFFLSGGNLFLRTKSNYNSSVDIIVSADFVYDTSNGGQFTRGVSITLLANGGNNAQLSNGVITTTFGRSCNANILDVTNNRLFRSMALSTTNSVYYFVEQLL